MSELSFEQMLDESFKTIHNGEVVEGAVIDVKPDEIILNIGYKADGIITKNEYSNDQSIDLTTVVALGDKMTVKVLKVNDGEGQVCLLYTSYRKWILSGISNALFRQYNNRPGFVSDSRDRSRSVLERGG